MDQLETKEKFQEISKECRSLSSLLKKENKCNILEKDLMKFWDDLNDLKIDDLPRKENYISIYGIWKKFCEYSNNRIERTEEGLDQMEIIKSFLKVSKKYGSLSEILKCNTIRKDMIRLLDHCSNLKIENLSSKIGISSKGISYHRIDCSNLLCALDGLSYILSEIYWINYWGYGLNNLRIKVSEKFLNLQSDIDKCRSDCFILKNTLNKIIEVLSKIQRIILDTD